jgi:hypothetical protein
MACLQDGRVEAENDSMRPTEGPRSADTELRFGPTRLRGHHLVAGERWTKIPYRPGPHRRA